MATKKPIGVWSDGLAGVELLDVRHGIEDVAVIRDHAGTVSEHIIAYTDDGDAYIKLGQVAYYFSECMRLEAV